jgi:hypothetical protein
MLANGLGQFFELVLLERLARVGSGLVNLVDCEVLECARILHDALLWAWVGCGCEADTLPCLRSVVGGNLG